MWIEIQEYEYLFDPIKVGEAKSDHHVCQKTVLKTTKIIY